jgi:RNA recognition motif-containing protein
LVFVIDGFELKGANMSTNIYVGNLTFDMNNSDLESLFAAYGDVTSAHVIRDRESGRSRGFGFVEMGSSESAQSAISELNGKDHNGRQLTVNVAKPRSG